MNFRDLLGLEKTYNTKDLYIARVEFIGEEKSVSRRRVFRGPFVKNGVKYYEMFPTMKPFYVYPSSDSIVGFKNFMSFKELFPELKKVSESQINNIVETLYQGDLIESSIEKVNSKKLELK